MKTTETDVTTTSTSLLEISEPVRTKREVLAQIMICATGCCCGRTDKKRPELPIDLLKAAWKERKLLKTVQLSFTGCLGPCDIANVFCISSAEGERWFGGIHTAAPFESLVEWAEQTRTTARIAPIPEILLSYEFQRFQPATESFEQVVATGR